MPMLHLHIALVFALAIVTAGFVYLLLAAGKSDPHPLKVARTVFLVVIFVNSTLYVGYYGVMYSRWSTQRHASEVMREQPMPLMRHGMVPNAPSEAGNDPSTHEIQSPDSGGKIRTDIPDDQRK